MSITKKLVIAAALSGAVLAPSLSMAQTAGGTVLGVSETVLADVVSGWSVKRTILNKAVYNNDAKPAKVGKIEDVIIAPPARCLTPSSIPAHSWACPTTAWRFRWSSSRLKATASPCPAPPKTPCAPCRCFSTPRKNNLTI